MYIIKSYFKCTFMWEVFLPFSSFSSFKNVMYQIRSGGIKSKPIVLKGTCRFDNLIMFNE